MEVQNLIFWAQIEEMRNRGEFADLNHSRGTISGAAFGMTVASLTPRNRSSLVGRHFQFVGLTFAGAAFKWIESQLRERRIKQVDSTVHQLINNMGLKELSATEVHATIANGVQPVWQARDAYVKVQTPALDSMLLESLKDHQMTKEKVAIVLGRAAPAPLAALIYYPWLSV